MVQRTVICDRCGGIVEIEHPDRISIYHHSIEHYDDLFGKRHKRSVYKADKPIHLCEFCNGKFKAFLGGS